MPIENVVLLGDRASGTSWLTLLLLHNFDVKVIPWGKHWLYTDVDRDPRITFEVETPDPHRTLVIVITRVVETWFRSMFHCFSPDPTFERFLFHPSFCEGKTSGLDAHACKLSSWTQLRFRFPHIVFLSLENLQAQTHSMLARLCLPKRNEFIIDVHDHLRRGRVTDGRAYPELTDDQRALIARHTNVEAELHMQQLCLASHWLLASMPSSILKHVYEYL